MRLRVVSAEDTFFDLFEKMAGKVQQGADELLELLKQYSDIDRRTQRVLDIEHEGDEITHLVMRRLNTTFVTPFDREDIHLLVTNLDDVIDLLDGAARRVAMFHITEVRDGARQLCDVLVRTTDAIQAAVGGMKSSRMTSERSREVKRLEEEGDAIYEQAIGRLFAGSPDPLDVIKWKEVYDKLEDAIDRCEDVANVLESIALKHA